MAFEWFKNLFSKRQLGAVGSFRLTDAATATTDVFGRGFGSVSGAWVSPENSLSLSAVFAGVNLLSRLISSLPLGIYQRVGEMRLENMRHPAAKVLGWEPNKHMTAATFRRTLEFHRLLYGAACAEIVWDGAGNVRELHPIEGYRVRPIYDDNGKLKYVVDNRTRIDPHDMLYVPLVSFDGVVGRGFVDFAIDSLGLSLSTQQFAAAYFGNGARTGGILSHPGERTPEQRRQIRESWNDLHQGPQNAHRIGVLWGGWEFKESAGANTAEQAQLLETRKFATEEVSRWLGIPPHLIADLSRATFSNIEQQNIEFLAYSLGPILNDYEQEFDRKLLNPPKLYCKHNVSALMRGDAAARGNYYSMLLNNGICNRNEIRALEDLNPIEGGDVFFVPANLMPLEKAISGDGTEEEPAGMPNDKPGSVTDSETESETETEDKNVQDAD